MKKINIYSCTFIALFLFLSFFLSSYKNNNFDRTFADKFTLRPNLISWAMNFKFLMLKDNYFSNIMFTADQSWLNYTGESSIDDSQNAIPFSDEQLEIIHVKLRNIQQTLKAQGIKFYIVIPPNKNTIYPEDLDRIAPKKQAKSRLDQVIEYESSHSGMDVIDIRSELFESKKTHQVYYATDTHWNDYGSLVGYFKIMNVISQDFPIISVNSIENYDIGTKKYSGDLSQMSGNLKIEENTQVLSLRNPLPVKYDRTELNNGQGVIRSQIELPDLPRALIFRDSFFTHLFGNVSQHFSTSICIWSFVFDFKFVDEVKPNLVIVEISERYIDQLLKLP